MRIVKITFASQQLDIPTGKITQAKTRGVLSNPGRGLCRFEEVERWSEISNLHMPRGASGKLYHGSAGARVYHPAPFSYGDR